jgi:hypothetical protein
MFHATDNTQRFAQGVIQDAVEGRRNHVALDFRCHPREILKPVDRPHEIEPAHVADRMSRILRLESGDRFAVILDETRKPQEQLPSLLRGEPTPRALERGPSGTDCIFDVRLARLRDMGEHLVGVGIVDGEGRTGVTRYELASDEEVVPLDVRHIRCEGGAR